MTLLGAGRIVGDDMVDVLHQAGVRAVFGLDDPRGFWVGARRGPVRPVIVHDERSGSFMAEAFIRAGGGLAATSGISGPGAANLVPGLLEAWASSIPLLAVIGEKRAATFGGNEFQGVDHRPLLGGVVKAVVEPRAARDVPAAAAHAVRLATSGRPRPVMLLTHDLLQWEPSTEPDVAKVVGTSSTRLGGADDAAVATAVDAISRAERVVLVLGGGALLSDAGPAGAALAERLGCPIVMTPMGKGSVSESHPHFVGIVSSYTTGRGGAGVHALQALQAADCIIVAGSDLDSLALVDGKWPGAGTTVVRIDVDPTELLAFADIALLGDAQAVIAQLSSGLDSTDTSTRADRLARTLGLAAEASAARAAAHAADVARVEAGTVWPGRVIADSVDALGADGLLVTDASFSSIWAVDRFVQHDPGRRVLTPRAAGTLGWGLPAAMGAKLAKPGSRVIGVVGDGGLLFSIGDMETAVRESLDVTIVVLDNGSKLYFAQIYTYFFDFNILLT